MTQAVALAQLGNSGVNFRNKIINGDMRIDQRNAGAAVTSTAYWPVDRFNLSMGAGSFTGQQVADAPAGFTYSLKLIQASYGSSSYKLLQQYVEGYNITDLNWGTSSAKNVTVSFWVKGSVTGTYTLTLQNAASGDGRWAYVSTYTINSANTWEYKTITVTAPTTATWASNNTRGIGILFDLGSTGYVTSTLNSWQNNNVFYASGAVDLSNSSGATWQVTGVQLEEGGAATAFEVRPYGTELQLCQRYYQLCNGFLGTPGATTTNMYTAIQYQTAMRSTPSLAQTGIITMSAPGVDVWAQSSTGISAGGQNTTGTWIVLNNFSGLTQHRPYVQSINYSSNGYLITLSSEL